MRRFISGLQFCWLRRVPLRLGLLAALVVGAPAAVEAEVLIPLPGSPSAPQIPSGEGPAAPDGRTVERRNPSRVGPTTGSQADRADTSNAASLFLPLQAGASIGNQQLLFEGQRTSRRFTVTLPAEATVAEATFVLSYLSSVQVLPSASRLRLTLNGTELLAIPPRAFSAPEVVQVKVPEGLLRPGPNEVSISLRQNHRILCTIDGIYELWTAVDALRSGLQLHLLEALATPTLATFDYALGSGLAGSRRLTFIAPANQPDEAWLGRALAVVQGAARRTSGPLPDFALVSQTELERGEPAAGSLRGIRSDKLPAGMLTVIGTAEELRELLPRQILGLVTGPYLGVHGLGRRDGGALLVLSGRDRHEVEQAIGDWASQRVELPRATSAITSALPPAPRPGGSGYVGGRTTVSLADLNVPEQQVSGLREIIPVELQLADDFFAANDAAVRLSLDAAYAPDLHPDSALNLLVNGRGAALVGLNKPGGGTFRNYSVELPLRYFQPGLNRVDFEVTLPSVTATADGFCPPGTVGLNEPPRFLLEDSTSFSFPAYARLGELPNLKLLAESGFPYLLNQEPMPTNLYLGARDRDTLAAAMTLVAAIARHADKPLVLSPTFSLSEAGDRDVLAVGPTNLLEAGLFGNAPLRQQNLIQAWARSRPLDPLVSDAREVAATQATLELMQRIEALRSGPDDERSAAASGRSGPNGEEEEARWYQRYLSFLPSWGSVQDEEQLGRRLLQQAGGDVTAVMMQYEFDRAPGRTVTLVTALDGPLLLAAVKRVTQPDYWEELRGDVAVWGAQPRTLGTALVGESYVFAPSELSLTNLRLVLSNWLSRNVGLLVGSVILVVLALTTVTHFLLRMDRRRRDLV